MNVLETERLALRELCLEDAEFIFGLVNEPSFVRFIGDKGVRTMDDARAYLKEGPLASYRANGYGLYLAVEKSSGRPIGICGLVRRPVLDDPDVGFALTPEFWRRGYASEAAAGVLDYARIELGLPRVAAVTQPDNLASIRTLEKLGMRFERMIRLSEDDVELQLFTTPSPWSTR